MRLTRAVIVSLFFFFFAFGIQSQVFAQAYSGYCTAPSAPNVVRAGAPAECNGCNGSPNVDACGWCKVGSNFSSNYETCRIAVSGYNTSQISPEVKSYVSSVAASKGVVCVSRTSETNGIMVKMNKGGFDNDSINNLLADPVCRLGGCGCTLNGIVFLGPPPKNEQIAYNQNGIFGTLTNATSAIAVIPVSTSDYIADLRDTLRNPLGAQPAYAQGLGFSALSPVLSLWKLFRNVAYFFFVIIFIVVGFLIMFRSKISGQAAVTIQQALPKIIVSLLLVTFSYAIAGLMIDLMYLIIYLMIGIFSAGGTLNLTTLTNIALSNNIFRNVTDLIAPSGPSTSAVGTIGGQIGGAVSEMLTGSGWAPVFSSFAGLGANIIFQLVMLVALVVNMFRVFFALLMAYVMVIFSVIFAPIQLLFGAIPGQNTFGAWLKGLLENLMVFPVVIFLLLCAQYFTHLPGGFGAAGQGGFAPPQLGMQQGASGTFVLAILQFGILALIPKAVEIAKGAVSGKLSLDPAKAMSEFYKSGKLGQTIGTGLIGGAVGGLAGSAIGGVAGFATGKGDFSQRMSRAKTGALVGGGVGLASPILAPAVARTGKQVVRGGFNQAMQAIGGRAYNEGRIELNRRGITADSVWNKITGKGPVAHPPSGASTPGSTTAGTATQTQNLGNAPSTGANTNDGGYGD